MFRRVQLQSKQDARKYLKDAKEQSKLNSFLNADQHVALRERALAFVKKETELQEKLKALGIANKGDDSLQANEEGVEPVRDAIEKIAAVILKKFHKLRSFGHGVKELLKLAKSTGKCDEPSKKCFEDFMDAASTAMSYICQFPSETMNEFTFADRPDVIALLLRLVHDKTDLDQITLGSYVEVFHEVTK